MQTHGTLLVYYTLMFATLDHIVQRQWQWQAVVGEWPEAEAAPDQWHRG